MPEFPRVGIRVADEGPLASPPRLNVESHQILPEWYHPYFDRKSAPVLLKNSEFESFAYSYYLRFLPFFRQQAEGSVRPGVTLTFSNRFRNKMGEAHLFDGKIILNAPYFRKDPILLPYTVFHELTHLWLYDCGYDPGHTWRFYEKMKQFEKTGLPVDPFVYIHKRRMNESRFVLTCPLCEHRWHVQVRPRRGLICGRCRDATQRLLVEDRGALR